MKQMRLMFVQHRVPTYVSSNYHVYVFFHMQLWPHLHATIKCFFMKTTN